MKTIAGRRSKLPSGSSPPFRYPSLLAQTSFRRLSSDQGDPSSTFSSAIVPPFKLRAKKDTQSKSKPVNSSVYTHLSFSQYLQGTNGLTPPTSSEKCKNSLRTWKPPEFRDLLQKPEIKEFSLNIFLESLKNVKNMEESAAKDKLRELLGQLKDVTLFELTIGEVTQLLRLLRSYNCHVESYKEMSFLLPSIYEYLALLLSKQSRLKEVLATDDQVLVVLDLTVSLGGSSTLLPRLSTNVLPEIIYSLQLSSLLTKSPSRCADIWRVLSSLDLRWKDIPFKSRRELISSLGNMETIPFVCGLSFAESVFLLRQVLRVMRGFESQLPEELQRLCCQLAEQILTMHPGSYQSPGEERVRSVDAVLSLYAAVDRSLLSLQSNQRRRIVEMLQSEWKHFSFAERCHILCQFGAIQGDLNHFPQDWRRNCLESLREELSSAANLTIYDIQNLFRGLSSLKCHWGEMSEGLRAALITVLERVQPATDASEGDYPLHFTSLITAVGLMRESSRFLPCKIHYHFFKTVDSFDQSLHPHLVCHLFQGFANLGYTLNELPGTIREKLFASFSTALNEGMVEKSILVDFAIAVVSLEPQWRDNSQIADLLLSILQFILVEGEMKTRDSPLCRRFGNLIIALGRSSCRWKDLPASVQSLLERSSREYCLVLGAEPLTDRDCESLISVMSSIALFGIPSSIFRFTFEQLLPQLVDRRLSADQTSEVLFFLSELSYSWSELSEKLRASLRECLLEGIANCDLVMLSAYMRSLAIMSFDISPHLSFESVHAPLLQRYIHLRFGDDRSKRPPFEMPSRGNLYLAIYLEWLRGLPVSITGPVLAKLCLEEVPLEVNRLPPSPPTSSSSQCATQFQSRLEEDLERVATAAGNQRNDKSIRLVSPFCAFESRIYPADVAILQDDHPVAFIFFSEGHSYSPRKLRFIEHLYHHRYPMVPVIHYSISAAEKDRQIAEYSQNLVEVLSPFL